MVNSLKPGILVYAAKGTCGIFSFKNLDYKVRNRIRGVHYFLSMHRGAFCQFPFWWGYYDGSNEFTGKETGKTHLCACVSWCLRY